MVHYVYEIQNTLNNATYTGMTSKSTLETPYMGSGKWLKLAQKKYGIQNFTKRILVVCISREHAADVERELIGDQWQNDDNYNMCPGGGNPTKGLKCTEESKRKMSEARRGKKFGPRSEETRRKIGNANRRKHKPHSEETRRKISESMRGKPGPNLGKKMSDETRLKLSKSLTLRSVKQ